MVFTIVTDFYYGFLINGDSWSRPWDLLDAPRSGLYQPYVSKAQLLLNKTLQSSKTSVNAYSRGGKLNSLIRYCQKGESVYSEVISKFIGNMG
jgi:hypothetical protein